MLVRIVLLLLAMMPMAASTEAGLINALFGEKKMPKSPQLIRVLLVHDKPGVVMEVKGKYKIYDPKDFSLISSRYAGQRRYIQAVRDGIKWGEEFPGVFQLMIVPDNQATTTIVDGIEYRGSIYVYDVGGTISIVNDVYVEDYIQSMLAPQYRDEMPEEVLAALAITARTAIYYEAQNPKNAYWDVDGRKTGYLGYAATNLNSPIEHAIYSTRYLVMTLPDNNAKASPFLAQWSSTKDKMQQARTANISLADAEAMAKKGDHAAQILSKAFPGATLVLMHSEAPAKVAYVK